MLDASQLRMETKEVKNLTEAKWTGGFLKTETRTEEEVSTEKINTS